MKPVRRARQAGFALVAVIWGLGLATLLGSAVIVGSHNRLKDVDTLADVAAASVGAESAVLFGIRKAMDGDPLYLRRRPVSCLLPDRARATLLITPESGKVDLNAAPPELLARLFVALTGDPRSGNALAQALVTFRGKPKAGFASGSGGDAGNAPLSTVLELDRVPDLPADLLFRALPFVTVASGKPQVDPKTAAPALLALLGLPPDPGTAAPLPGGAVTVHAELQTAGGTWAVRDALVDLGDNGSFTIREWRVGQRDAEPDGAEPAASEHACLS